VDHSNEQKQKEVQGITHICATTLIAIKRAKPKENHRMMVQIIEQVMAEFKLWNL
jgi:hypothetical protein